MNTKTDLKFMKLALKEAEKAYKKDEVPIGAVIVKDDKVIARAHNTRITKSSSIAHAEINVIQKTSKKLKNWVLSGTTLYVTVEPCLMCAGAIIHSRIDRVVYGCKEPKMGAVESQYQVFGNKGIHHVSEYTSGILEEECSQILKLFFKAKRSIL